MLCTLSIAITDVVLWMLSSVWACDVKYVPVTSDERFRFQNWNWSRNDSIFGWNRNRIRDAIVGYFQVWQSLHLIWKTCQYIREPICHPWVWSACHITSENTWLIQELYTQSRSIRLSILKAATICQLLQLHSASLQSAKCMIKMHVHMMLGEVYFY